MTQLTNIEETLDVINTGEPVLIYFSGKNCSVCHVLKPKIEKAVIDNFEQFKIFEVNTDIYKEITSHFTVFSIPTMLVFFDSREFKRYGRNTSVSLFIEELKRPYNLMIK